MRAGWWVALSAGVLAVVVLGWLLRRRGGRRRVAQAADLPDLHRPPERARLITEALPGTYVGTTLAGDGLDRVVAHGLSERSPARLLLVEQGVVVDRLPGPFLIPRAALREVRTDSAHTGKGMGRQRLLVLSWTHGDRLLDSGFRADSRQRQAQWVDRLRTPPPPGPGGDPGEPAAPTPTGGPTATPIGPDRPTEPTTPLDPLTAPLAEVEAMLRRGARTVDGEPSAAGPDSARTAGPVATRRAGGAGAATLVGRAVAPAVLVLEDGRVFRGTAYGADGVTVGEAVFATGMTGYQETLTDPSYAGQVIVMTAPHIGNTGMNTADQESDRIHAAGLVVRDPARRPSSHRSERSLAADLEAAGVVGIAGVDTRALTRHLRERGAMRVGLAGGDVDVATLLDRVRAAPTMTGAELARAVSTRRPYVVPATGERRFRIAAVDLGVKRSSLAMLAGLGAEVHVLPAATAAEDLLGLDPDGVFLSNGPGDPAAVAYAVATAAAVLGAGRPLFGICFGHQVLGRALGLDTYKLGYGHRGINRPVLDRRSGRVAITSHNHGFAVAAPVDGSSDTPYGAVEVSHVDLNDGVVEGLRCRDVPAFSVQYHPEAAPGPHDAAGLFAEFVATLGRVPA